MRVDMPVEQIELNDDLKTFLSNAGLPVADLADETPVQFFAVKEEARLTDVVGLEIYHPVGLLRSLAVDGAPRKSGYGRLLVAHAEDWANECGIESLYLLTTTAQGFFTRLGYTAIPRSHAPEPIAESAQFSGLCPVSATFMFKRLKRVGLHVQRQE